MVPVGPKGRPGLYETKNFKLDKAWNNIGETVTIPLDGKDVVIQDVTRKALDNELIEETVKYMIPEAP
jgi:hypothetical protein